MTLHRLPASFAPVLALLLLSFPARAAPTPPDPDQAAQAYVQGRLALADNDLAIAANRFEAALKAGADDGLKRRAMDVAVLSGDMKAAVRLAGLIDISGEAVAGQAVGNSLIALTRVVDAMTVRDWRGYDEARDAFIQPGRGADSTPIISTLLKAYGRAGRGDADGALALLDPEGARGIARSYLAEHRGHLLVLARRWPEAADAFGAIIAAEGANVTRLRLAAVASALEAGQADPAYRTKAIAWLGSGNESDPVLVHARARFGSNPRTEGRKLGGLIEKPADGLALLFLRVATDLSRDRANGPSLGFARLATLLSPHMPEAWLVTTDVLARADRPELALAAIDRLPDTAPWNELALSRRAAVLIGEDRYEEARALLRAPTTGPNATLEDWMRYAEVDRRAGNHKAAAESYGRAVALLPAELGPQHAQIFFLRGSAHELSANWAAAEADLRRAVELSPENAIYLNYLGYSLLDRRVKLAEARALIARAFKLAPDNGAIIDSMGWAEHVSGNSAEAVRLLEMARAAEPADPTVADHLGDALWQAGRRIEARHAWASAAALEPEPKLAALLARKLDYGLDIALASR
jgi:tetratricopeptide (TPR) repeat protein